jgi:hypothetical protein
MGLGQWETFKALSTIMSILGTTAPSLWPCLERTGGLVSGLSVGDLVSAETGGVAEALEDDFAPVEHAGKVHSYHFHPTGDHHLAGIDHANFSFGDGLNDSPFSVGAWILPNAIASNVIIAKYDAAGNLEEWRFWIGATGLLTFELHDASVPASEVAASASALVLGQQHFVCATYDGGETAPVVNLYVDGTLVNDGTTVETGAYVAMEATATPLTVGCDGVTALPTNEFHGRIALPFVTGKALTAAEVRQLFDLYRLLLGV